jgi:glycosyltransferase involved in cell wall biosynthesis
MDDQGLRLAVIVPAYNESDTLRLCLEHLLPQDVDEVIVVDNNSTDDTADIAREFASTDPRVRVVEESVQGLIAARNRGFGSTDADILGRIDADTRVRPNWVAEVRRFFTENEDFDGVSGLSLFYDSPFRVGRMLTIRFFVRIKFLGNNRPIDNIHGANMAIRRSAWEKVRDITSHRADVHEDIDLALSILDVGGKIASSHTIWADLSPRRNLEPPWSYRKHIAAGVLTYRLHDRIDPFTEYVFAPLSWLWHLIMWAPYRAWDPERKRFSIRHLLRRMDYRVSGMG